MKTINYMSAVFGTVVLCGCATGVSVPAMSFPASSAQGNYAIYFGTGNAEIDHNASVTIKQAADSFRSGNYTSVAVVGHTDTAGAGRYNQGLSERRAAAARAELVRDGVPSERILTGAAGETAPQVWTPDMTPDSDNRRVIIALR